MAPEIRTLLRTLQGALVERSVPHSATYGDMSLAELCDGWIDADAAVKTGFLTADLRNDAVVTDEARRYQGIILVTPPASHRDVNRLIEAHAFMTYALSFAKHLDGQLLILTESDLTEGIARDLASVASWIGSERPSLRMQIMTLAQLRASSGAAGLAAGFLLAQPDPDASRA